MTARLSALSLSPLHPFFLLYISTDYAFLGFAPSGGYEPDASVEPTNLYGRTKEQGEREVLAGLEKGGKGTVLAVPVL